MTSPPKKRNPAPATTGNGVDENNRIADIRVKREEQNFKPELWPANVSRLHAAGITFEWRRGSHDIVTACPACGSKLAIDAEKPFWLCLGPIRCEANRIPFAQVVAALTEKVEVAR